jgi:hypothetical protein
MHDNGIHEGEEKQAGKQKVGGTKDLHKNLLEQGN